MNAMRRLLQAILAIAILWLVGEMATLAYFRRSLSSGWPTPSGRLADIAHVVPDQSENKSAHELEQLARPLSIDIVPKTKSHVGQNHVDRAPWKAIEPAIKDYLRDAIVAEPARQYSAPPPVALFISEHAASLNAVVDHLESGESPRWEIRTSAGWQAPLPNLLGHIALVRLLVAAALNTAAAGDNAAAWRELRAAAVLTDSALSHPFLISQLIGYAETTLIVGSMRQIKGCPEWSLHWPSADLKAALIRAATVEAWPLYRPFTETPGNDVFTAFADDEQKPSIGGRILSGVLGPYLLASAANTAETHRYALHENITPDICDQQTRIISDKAIASWNVFGRVAFTGEIIGTSFHRMRHLAANIQGTRLILLARSAKQVTGTWPSSTPQSVSPCSHLLWASENKPNQYLIRAVPAIPPLENKGAINLPQEHVEE